MSGPQSLVKIFKMALLPEVRERVSFRRDAYPYLIRGLVKQRKTLEFCDISLKLNGASYGAHKAVLAATSPYFRSMFRSKMKEQMSSTVDLSQSLVLDRDDSFKLILDFLYTGDIEITTMNADDVMRIADFFILDDVKHYCQEFYLVHGNLNLKNCMYLSALADHHSMPDLAEAALKMVRSRFHDHLLHSDQILELPEDIFAKFLHDRETIQFAKPGQIVRAILRWLRHSYLDRRSCLPRIFACIHFNISCLSDSDIKTVSDQEPLLTDEELCYKLKCTDQYQGIEGAQHLDSTVMNQRSYGSDESVLIVLGCNQSVRHLSLLLYRIKHQEWMKVPLGLDPLMMSIPSRMSVLALTYHKNIVYMYLTYKLPYPADMHHIHIMAYDVNAGQHFLLTFRHRYHSGVICSTTLTDDNSMPPVLLYCNGCLCLVGNIDGSGHIFICDLTSQTYMTYQMNGTRFVSQARGLVKNDCRLYLWMRHRLGHEEYCMHKETGFAVFNVKTKCFENEHPLVPPGISYEDFSAPHLLCLEDNQVVIHSPGKTSLILNEKQNQWDTHCRSVPCIPPHKNLWHMESRRLDIYAHCDESVFFLQNSASYTSAMWCLSPEHPAPIPLTPPPTDGLSVVTPAHIASSMCSSLLPCKRFDEAYTRKLLCLSSPEDEEFDELCLNNHSEEDEGSFEYDDDIYGFYE
jgi:hypothetical protein